MGRGDHICRLMDRRRSIARAVILCICGIALVLGSLSGAIRGASAASHSNDIISRSLTSCKRIAQCSIRASAASPPHRSARAPYPDFLPAFPPPVLCMRRRLWPAGGWVWAVTPAWRTSGGDFRLIVPLGPDN